METEPHSQEAGSSPGSSDAATTVERQSRQSRQSRQDAATAYPFTARSHLASLARLQRPSVFHTGCTKTKFGGYPCLPACCLPADLISTSTHPHLYTSSSSCLSPVHLTISPRSPRSLPPGGCLSSNLPVAALSSALSPRLHLLPNLLFSSSLALQVSKPLQLCSPWPASNQRAENLHHLPRIGRTVPSGWPHLSVCSKKHSCTSTTSSSIQHPASSSSSSLSFSVSPRFFSPHRHHNASQQPRCLCCRRRRHRRCQL